MAQSSCQRAGGGRPELSVVDAIRRHVGEFMSVHHPSSRVTRALDWICACQTEALGGHLQACECGWSRPVYNPCGQRNCPQCRGGARAQWLDDREHHHLPVPHFQVVFTIPEPLRALARDNPAIVYGAMFVACHDTLKTLARQRFDATLGVTEVLHTWTRDLLYHPHIHCIVTAGGLSSDGKWIETRTTFLFPQRVMASMFRGKVMEALRKAHAAGQLRVPDGAGAFEKRLRAAYRHPWVVHVEAPNGRPAEQVAKYLARYVYGGPISDSRVLEITDSTVDFAGKRGPVTVAGAEFVRRFSLHFLPRMLNRARYYGLYSNSSRKTRLVQAREALGAPVLAPVHRTPPVRCCPRCGKPVHQRGIPDVPYSRPRRPPTARAPP